MDQYIYSILKAIEDANLSLQSYLPEEFSKRIENIGKSLNSYHPLLIFIMILLVIKLLFKIIPNLPKLLSLNTYTLFFYNHFKDSLLKSKLEKERLSIYKLAYEEMHIDKNELKLKIFDNKQSKERLLGMLLEIQKNDKSHFDKVNKQTGCVYSNNKDIDIISQKAAELYAFSDINFPEIFPSAKKIENNLIDIMLELFNASKDGCGIVTTGGTESILHALLGAKMYGRSKNITTPNIIAGLSVHPAFDKGCDTFGIELIKVSLTKDFKANIVEMKKKINKNTVLLVGSAINFPHGMIDDLSSINELAIENDLLFHVDACMGGFLTCFIDDVHKDFTNLDFRLSAVTSLSCDVHKYGQTQKGASVILFKNRTIRSFCSFGSVGNEGLYITPGIPDTRSASLIASAYMTIIYNGRKTYIDQAKRITEIIQKIKNMVRTKTPKLWLMGDPLLSIFAIGGERIGGIHKELKEKKWCMNLLNNPIGVNFCITIENIKSFEDGSFEKDLVESYYNVYESGKAYQVSGLAAMYGLAGMLPEEVVKANMDVILNCMLDDKKNLNSTIYKKDNEKEKEKVKEKKEKRN